MRQFHVFFKNSQKCFTSDQESVSEKLAHIKTLQSI